MSRYHRTWRDSRNAVGFAAACARLALPFYDGEYRSDVVRAIELAERHVSGASDLAAYKVAYTAHTAVLAAGTRASAEAARAASLATLAADAAAAAHTAAHAADAACAAASAGADSDALRNTYATWIVRDLVDRSLDAGTERACVEAVLLADLAGADVAAWVETVERSL